MGYLMGNRVQPIVGRGGGLFRVYICLLDVFFLMGWDYGIYIFWVVFTLVCDFSCNQRF